MELSSGESGGGSSEKRHNWDYGRGGAQRHRVISASTSLAHLPVAHGALRHVVDADSAGGDDSGRRAGRFGELRVGGVRRVLRRRCRDRWVPMAW